ncbi:MAG: P-II family nitrogen regulator [Methylococcales bacterium]
MKEIRAYIQPFMLSKLTQALLEIPGFPGMSVSHCEGFGRTKAIENQNYTPFIAKTRIEIFAPEALVERIFDTVMIAANTHQHGAGKVYIMNVIEGGRIGTSERGRDVA